MSTTAVGAAQAPPGPQRKQWGALFRLLVVVAAALVAAYAGGVGETVVLILAFLFCIVLHELGHFLAAKAAGMKVTEFFVGFGPRVWSIRRGETEYGIKALPLGGYCKIIGMTNLEQVDPADEARAYRSKPVWRRLTVAAAGSAMHFMLAIVLLFAMFWWAGDDGSYLPIPASNPIIAIDKLTTGASPARAAGFRLGDRIVSVNGEAFRNFTALAGYIESHAGDRMDVSVLREGKVIHLFPTPVNREGVAVAGQAGQGEPNATKPTGFLGVEVSGIVHSSLGSSIVAAGGSWVRASALTVHALGHLVTFHGIHQYFSALVNKSVADNPNNQTRFVSPVGVVRLFHSAGQQGLSRVLYLLAILNISVGIFNMIPLLPLDGGHVVIALYEGARSRRSRPYHADVSKLMPLFYLALALIAFLGVSALFLDLRDLVT
ncbi:MAG: M50 family metallopeptidase [Acidimicrobiales bacterium]